MVEIRCEEQAIGWTHRSALAEHDGPVRDARPDVDESLRTRRLHDNYVRRKPFRLDVHMLWT
jgi:hypothetical protein